MAELLENERVAGESGRKFFPDGVVVDARNQRRAEPVVDPAVAQQVDRPLHVVHLAVGDGRIDFRVVFAVGDRFDIHGHAVDQSHVDQGGQ